MAKKYYVVWAGRTPGIFSSWADCKSQVDGFSGAKYKSFTSLAEANAAFSGNSGGDSQSDAAKSVKASGAVKKTGAAKKTGNTNKAQTAKAGKLTQSQIDEMPYNVKIYTDGACDPNPGEAGTGLAVYQDNALIELWYGLYYSFGTNNTAELNGLMQALLLAQDKLAQDLSVAIYCDSKYSIDCVTKWAAGWQKKNWTRPGGEIKNLDIIKPAFALYQELAEKISIYHVNGHVGIEGNELADRMSIVAIDRQDESLSLYRESESIAEILALRAG